jgi:hypothetical protein
MRPLLDLDFLPASVDRVARRQHLDMPLVLVDLPTMSERGLQVLGLTDLACIALLFFRVLQDTDSKLAGAAFRRWRRPLLAVAGSPTGREDLEALFSYLHATTDLDLEHLRQVLAEIHPRIEHAYMTTADRLRRQGIKEGTAKGIATTLRRQLKRRFGTLPESVLARIDAASKAEIDRYTDLVLTARTLDEIFADS